MTRVVVEMLMLKIYRKRLDWDGKAKLIMLIVKPFNVLREEIIQSGMVERMTMLKKKKNFVNPIIADSQ